VKLPRWRKKKKNRIGSLNDNESAVAFANGYVACRYRKEEKKKRKKNNATVELRTDEE